MDVARPIDTVHETLGYVCLRCSSDNNVGDSLRWNTDISEQGGLSIEEWFGMEPQETPTWLCERGESKSYNCAIYKKDFLAIAEFLSKQVSY